MILVAEGWRRCACCRLIRPVGHFNAKKRWPDGSVRFYQSYCKRCALKRNRELNGWKPRRRMSAAQKTKRDIEKRLAYEERILADPVRFAEVQAKRRMDARLYRDRKRGGPPRPYPLRKTKLGVAVTERYRPPSKAEMVSAEPLRDYLKRTFYGWNAGEISTAHGQLMHRRILAVLSGEQDRIELDAVDRFLTLGLHRPDLLNDLYPLEEKAS